MCVHARVRAHVGTHTHTCLHISIAGFQNTFVRTNSVKWELRSSLVPSESGSMLQGLGTGAPGVCTGLVQLNGLLALHCYHELPKVLCIYREKQFL